MTRTVNVSDVIDNQPVGAFQLRVFFLCAAVLFVDGFDVQGITYVAPAISQEWGLARGALGPTFSAGLFGVMLGAMLLAPLADRIGRRRVIVLSCVAFGIGTLLTLLVDSLSALLVLRFFTGLGLGSALPNAIGLASEYAPHKRRALIVMFVGSGGSGKSGTVLAGLLNGLDSVGDDYVLVGLQDGTAAYPLFRTLKQDPAGWERLGLDARLQRPASLNWQGKYQFRLEDIASRPVPARMAMTAMMVPKVSGTGRTTITPMPRKEAIVALAAPGLMQMTGDRASGFRFFSELTRRLPCYEASLGVDPKEVAETIREFIERTGA